MWTVTVFDLAQREQQTDCVFLLINGNRQEKRAASIYGPLNVRAVKDAARKIVQVIEAFDAESGKVPVGQPIDLKPDVEPPSDLAVYRAAYQHLRAVRVQAADGLVDAVVVDAAAAALVRAFRSEFIGLL